MTADPNPPGSLEQQAEAFASELTGTLRAVLPGAPGAVAEVSEAAAGRVVVMPEADVPLLVDGEHLAYLDARLRCEIDSRGTWLAVEYSSFALRAEVDRIPLLRFDFVRKPNRIPSSHIQVHAHRGALTHLLSQARHPKPHDMSALHIPTGGARFRPCLEDVLQFLVADCGFDALPGWEAAIHEGRARWRRIQAAAVVRDFPEEAASTLVALGYEVIAPDPVPAASPKALTAW